MSGFLLNLTANLRTCNLLLLVMDLHKLDCIDQVNRARGVDFALITRATITAAI